MDERRAIVRDADCTEQREIAGWFLDELGIEPTGVRCAGRGHQLRAGQGVVLGCGTEDAMVSHGELVDLDQSALSLDGLGHNLHVEAPDRVAELILASLRGA